MIESVLSIPSMELRGQLGVHIHSLESFGEHGEDS